MKQAVLQSVSRERPVLIAGPTASGKSALALEIASRDNRVIINADALQVYDTWRILTARPSVADEAAVPHALYGHIARDQPYSVGHWLREVQTLLDRPVVIVGGTGLYFMALTEGLTEIPDTPPAIRAEADALRQAGHVARMIAALDAETRARIDLANPVRVQRAFEVQRATGRGLAAWQNQTASPLLPLTQCHTILLQIETARLNARIDLRFSAMLDAGVLQEVAAALPDWQPDQPYARAIGAPDLVAHLRGASDLATAAASACLSSRQYAKRQRTWFRKRMASWQMLSLT